MNIFKPKELTETRKRLGVSQLRLSVLACVSRYRISLFESCYIELTPAELGRIKKVLQHKMKSISQPCAQAGDQHE